MSTGLPVRMDAGALVSVLGVGGTLGVLMLARGGTAPMALLAALPLLALAWMASARTGSEERVLRSWAVPVGVCFLVGLGAVLLGPGFGETNWARFGRFHLYLLVGWMIVGVVMLLPREGARAVAWTLVGLALFQACYGLLALVRGSEMILGLWPRNSTHVVTGTFINRNHVADVLSAGWLVGLGLCLSGRWPAAVRWTGMGMVSLLSGAALFATQSRGGVLSFGAGAVVFVALALRRGHLPGAHAGAVGGALVVGLVAAVWFGMAGLILRFMSIPEEVGRARIWQSMLEAPVGVWLRGVGPGQFVEAFPAWKTVALVQDTTAAHNDWLEFFFEFGVPGGLVVLSVFAWWAWRQRPREIDTLRAAALGAMVVFAVHALGDFSLQLPGAAAVFAVCTGLFFRRAEGPPGEQRSGPRQPAAMRRRSSPERSQMPGDIAIFCDRWVAPGASSR